MALADTAQLAVRLSLDDDFSKGIGKADSKLTGFGKKVGQIGSKAAAGAKAAAGNIAKIGAVAAIGIGAQVKFGLDSLAELEDATTSVTGAINAMGEQGQITAKQVATWANEIEASVEAAFDDKAITQAATTLIRFGKVTPKNLRQALVVMTDLAAKTGDVDSASTLLARALADPTKAAGKLARAGVILTKEQQKQITALVKAGKVSQAQALILDALAKSTAGAAKASAGPYRDSLNILADVTEDAQRALAEGFLPVITKVRDILSKQLAKPEVIQGIRDFGKGIAGALDSLIGIATKLPWATIGESLRIAGTGARAILDAFLKLPPWVQTAVITGWGLNKLTGGALGSIVSELGKGLIKGVLGMTAGVVNIKAGVVNGAPGGPTGEPGGGGLRSFLGAAGIALIAGEVGIAVIDGFQLVGKEVGKSIFGQQFGDIADRLGTATKQLTALGSLDALNHIGDIPAQLGKLIDVLQGRRSPFEGLFGTPVQGKPVPPNANKAFFNQLGQLIAAPIRVVAASAHTIATASQRTAATIDQFHRVQARLAKEKTDPFRFIRREAQQGDAKGGILPVISTLVRAFTNGDSAWARDIGKMKNHLQNLKDAEAAFRAKGDTKTANAIGAKVKALQAVIDAKLAAANSKLDAISTNTAKQGPRIPGSADTGSESSGTRFNSNPASVTTASEPIVSAVTSEGKQTRTTIATTAAGAAAANATQTQRIATAIATTAAGAAAAQTTATNAASARSEASAIRIASAAQTIANRQFETNAKLDANQVQDLRAYTAQQASSARNEAAVARLTTTTATTAAQTKAAVVAAAAATQGVIKAGDTRSESALTRINTTSSQLSGKMSRIGGSVAQIPGAIRAAKPVVNVTVPVRVSTTVSVRDTVRAKTHVDRYGHVVHEMIP